MLRYFPNLPPNFVSFTPEVLYSSCVDLELFPQKQDLLLTFFLVRHSLCLLVWNLILQVKKVQQFTELQWENINKFWGLELYQ